MQMRRAEPQCFRRSYLLTAGVAGLFSFSGLDSRISQSLALGWGSEGCGLVEVRGLSSDFPGLGSIVCRFSDGDALVAESPGSGPWGCSGGALFDLAMGLAGCGALRGFWGFLLIAPERTLQGVSLGFHVESADAASPFWGVTVVRALPAVSLWWTFGRATGLGAGSLLLAEGLFETTWAKDGITGCSWLVALGHVG